MTKNLLWCIAIVTALGVAAVIGGPTTLSGAALYATRGADPGDPPDCDTTGLRTIACVARFSGCNQSIQKCKPKVTGITQTRKCATNAGDQVCLDANCYAQYSDDLNDQMMSPCAWTVAP